VLDQASQPRLVPPLPLEMAATSRHAGRVRIVQQLHSTTRVGGPVLLLPPLRPVLLQVAVDMWDVFSCQASRPGQRDPERPGLSNGAGESTHTRSPVQPWGNVSSNHHIGGT